MKILLIEDEKITRKTLTDFIIKEGYEIFSTGDGLEAAGYLQTNTADVVITDLMLPGMNGMELLKAAKERNSSCEVIIMTAYATVETAVEALKLGAYDYLTKPFNPERLLSILAHFSKLSFVIGENEELKSRLKLIENNPLIGNSAPMKKLADTIRMVARTDSTVLIEGESGTGKEICARSIHNCSGRAKGNFIAVNCAVIPESLLESEMFGHEKGAFTGASRRHNGYFERAEKGTLFIDDIDDMPLLMQVKLLRVLQEKEIVRVGGSDVIPVDVRIICATKVNLLERVDAKLFRDDLFYRLNIIPLKLPPLRERKEDIPLLIEHFLKKHKTGNRIPFLDRQMYEKLSSYEWKGNVRELENVIERMIAMSGSETLNSAVLDYFNPGTPEIKMETGAVNAYPPFEEYIVQKEKEIINWAMRTANNNLTNAARILQIPRTTLHSKIDKLFKSGGLAIKGQL